MLSDFSPPRARPVEVGFLEDTVDTRSSDGRNDTLLSNLHFLDIDGTVYRAPKGADTDGGSTPRIVWLVPGFEPTGKHWKCWILHDSGYRNTLQIFKNGTWVKANLTQKECDQLLDRAIKSTGTNKASRLAVYGTLRVAGWKSYTKR